MNEPSYERTAQFNVIKYPRNPLELDADIGDMPNIPTPPQAPSMELLNTLLELGAIIPDLSRAQEAIDVALDRAGFERGADALNWIMAKVGRHTAAGAALERVICGAGESLRAVGDRVGTSHTAIAKHERAIAAKIAAGLHGLGNVKGK